MRGSSTGDSEGVVLTEAPGISQPRVELGTFPTPVEAAPELGAEIGVPDLYVKREGQSGELYGGNKIRKLEYLLGEALDRDCSRVHTFGGIGSNHVLATATYAREVGLEPHVTHFPQPVTSHVLENLRALARFEPELTLTRSEVLLPAHLLKKRLESRFDEDCYLIPPGGSSPVGTVGYVEAAHELARQLDAGEFPRPDVVVVPASSGGTLAGLRVGFDSAGLDARLVGVSVVEWYVANGVTLSRLANKTAKLLDDTAGGRDSDRSSGDGYSRHDIELLTGYLGEGYAEPTPEGERIQDVAAQHGLQLDPTYTAKTVAAITSEFDEETVLYWHTLSETRPEPLPTERTLEVLPDSYRQFF